MKLLVALILTAAATSCAGPSYERTCHDTKYHMVHWETREASLTKEIQELDRLATETDNAEVRVRIAGSTATAMRQRSHARAQLSRLRQRSDDYNCKDIE